jgi:hypothetical protein
MPPVSVSLLALAVGAVAQAVAEVDVAAETGWVSAGAAQLGRLAQHIVEAGLAA